MRAIFASLLIMIASVVGADIPKPSSINETLDLMLERVLPTFPQARIDQRDRNIKLDDAGEMIINPDNIHAVLQTINDGAAREAELDRFMATLLNSMTAEPRDTSTLPMDQIYPVVRHVTFGGGAAGVDLFSLPFVGDMMRIYAIDYPDRVAYVTYSDMEDAGVSPDQLEAAAFANLDAKLSVTEFQQNGPFFMVLTDGFYESSMALDEGLWEDISAQFGSDIVMIVPARDLLVFTPAGNPEANDLLAEIMNDTLMNGTHPLSETMYIWRDGSWQVLDR